MMQKTSFLLEKKPTKKERSEQADFCVGLWMVRGLFVEFLGFRRYSESRKSILNNFYSNFRTFFFDFLLKFIFLLGYPCKNAKNR